METAELMHIHRTMDEAANTGDTDALDALVEQLKNRLRIPRPAHARGGLPPQVRRTLMIRSGLVGDRAELRVTTIEAMGTDQFALDLRVWLLGRLATIATVEYERTGRHELVTVADTIFHLGLRDAQETGGSSEDPGEPGQPLPSELLPYPCRRRSRTSREVRAAGPFTRETRHGPARRRHVQPRHRTAPSPSSTTV